MKLVRHIFRTNFRTFLTVLVNDGSEHAGKVKSRDECRRAEVDSLVETVNRLRGGQDTEEQIDLINFLLAYEPVVADTSAEFDRRRFKGYLQDFLGSSPPACRRPSVHETVLQRLRVVSTEVGLLLGA
jgi:hypothetical protein